MTNFKIKVAGRVASVTAMYESSKRYCKDYLTEETPDFSVEITSADIDFERDKNMKTSLAEGRCDAAISDSQLEITAIQRKIAEQLFACDAIVFHGSAVAVDGKAYLFTAKEPGTALLSRYSSLRA